MIQLEELLPLPTLIMDLKAKDKKSAIRELIRRMVDLGKIKEDDLRKVERLVNKREGQGSTAIGKGLAIPHAKSCRHVTQIHGVYGRSIEGLPFDSVDGGAVFLVFMVISPAGQEDDHLTVMRKIANLHRDGKTLKFLAGTESTDSVVDIFREVDEKFR